MMENDKRLIYADAIESSLCNLCDEFGTDHLFIDAIVYEIGNAPTVDAVEVVRCKDCKHWIPDNKPMPWCRWVQLFRNEDDFCSYGERIEKSEDKEKA